ncbi:MAG: pitrilysin family protein, partial [Candidatus Taylorbacteria bacterium]|nr:pitrilysin family protein [Candidatus Taylorbacteria bacterium]
TIVHIPRPGSLNVSLNLMAIAGSMYESLEEVGIAHFLEHLVSDGTEKYPDEKKLALLIDERGGIRNASTSKETIEYFVKILREDMEIAFEYLSEISIRPLLKEADIEKQKRIIEQEIYRFKSDPEKLAQRLIYSVIFPGTRLGSFSTGDVDDIKKISRSSILAYHRRTHCAKNMVLSVCGDISEEQIRVFTERYFADLVSGEKMPTIDPHAMPKEQPTFQVVFDSRQAVLTVGYNGVRLSDERHYAADLLPMLLTRGRSSRLYHEIREKRSLAYVVSSNNFNGRNMGIFTIQVGLANDKITECLGIIKTELERIISEDISDGELHKALAFIRSGIAFSSENSLWEASYYSRLWCSTGMIRSINEELAYYESIIRNPNVLKEFWKKMFHVGPAILAIGGQGMNNRLFIDI